MKIITAVAGLFAGALLAENQAVSIRFHAMAGGDSLACGKSYAGAVPDRQFLASLKPGLKMQAGVRKRGSNYLLEPIPNRKGEGK
jgi:hypothetical protein